jgi:hypothetical protein
MKLLSDYNFNIKKDESNAMKGVAILGTYRLVLFLLPVKHIICMVNHSICYPVFSSQRDSSIST